MDTLLLNKLLAETGVTTLVAQRVYPTNPTTDTTIPYLVYSRSEVENFPTLGGPSSLHRYEYVIDAHDKDQVNVSALLAAVYSALKDWRDSTVRGVFRSGEGMVEEQYENGTYHHGQASYSIFSYT